MSKLSIIRKSLEEKAVIAHTEEEIIPLDTCMGWPHKVTFCIAPKEPLYRADELNRFMDSLVPDIEPSLKSYFRQEKESLITGALCFDEKIGYKVPRLEVFSAITDTELAEKMNIGKGILSLTIDPKDYMRRITIRPYPSKDIAEEILHHNLPKWKIPMELIWEYHDDRKWWQKLLKKLHHEH